MAIRMRYGLESQFDPSKAITGEWLVSTDKRYVRMCFAPGICLRMATYEAFEADMAKIENILAECRDIHTAITRIKNEVNANVAITAEYAADAKAYAESAAESADKAKMYAENASTVTNVQIAKEDTAGIIKGGDNHIAEDGTLTLTARTNTGLLEHSHAGGIRLHSITAVEDRQNGVPSPGEWVVSSNNHLDVTLTDYTEEGLDISLIDVAGIHIAGTATAAVDVAVGKAKLKAGTYYASVECSGETGTIFDYVVKGADGAVLISQYVDTTDARHEVEFTITSAQTVTFELQIPYGEVFGNDIYPMIATESGATWDVYSAGYTEGYPQPIEATSMKNLLPFPDKTLNVNGLTVTQKDGALSVSGTQNGSGYSRGLGNTVLKAGKYTLSTNKLLPSGMSVNLLKNDSSYAHITSLGNADTVLYKSFTLTEDTPVILALAGTENTNTYNVSGVTFQIERGNIVTAYVPYGCLRAVGNGAQLIPYPFNDTSKTTAGVTITDNGDGSLTLNGTSTSTIYYTLFKDKTPISEPCFLSGDGADYMLYAYGTDGIQYVDKGEGVYLPNGFRTVTIYINSGKTFNNEIVKPMINYGTEALPWEPYTEQSTILSKQFADFHNIGGVSDVLTPEAEVRRFAKARLTIDDLTLWRKTGTKVDRYYRSMTAVLPSADVSRRGQILCTHFRKGTNGEVVGTFMTNSSGYIGFAFTESGVSTLDEFKEWLDANEVYLVYPIADEVTPLPASDQIALNSLKSYDGVTHLYTDTYPPMVIDCEYGTSKVGAEMIAADNKGTRAEIENAELRSMITNLATALVVEREA